MTTKSKRPRAQAKSAVILPPNPVLDGHAAAIKQLGRRVFTDLVEIGERLIACKKLLKDERRWTAWLDAEFSWSRRTAERYMSVFENRSKLGKLPTLLPASALYLLAKASPVAVRTVERRAESGERVSVRMVREIVADASPPRRVAVQVETEAVEVRSVAYAETPSDDQQRLIDFFWTMKAFKNACALVNLTSENLTCLKPEHQMMFHDEARAIIAEMEPLTKPFLTVVDNDDDPGTRH